MAEPVFREGSWWIESDYGAWLRWDERVGVWSPAPSVSPRGSFRDLSTRGAWAVGALALAVAVDAVALLSDLAEYSLLDRVSRGLSVSFAEAAANDERQAQLGLAQAAAAIFTGIVFIVWFHAAYANLKALGATNTRFGTGWAIGGWFVPILNLWRPKQIANDIWRGSEPDAFPEQGGSWRSRPVPALLTWWWATWIAASLSYQAAFRYAFSATDPSLDQLLTLSRLWIAGDTLYVVAGVLAILVVRRTTERQMRRAAALRLPRAAGGGAAPPR